MKLRPTILALLITVFACAALLAQAPVVGSTNPESLFTSKDPKLHANKQVVMHIMRDLLEANHWADAPKYLSQRYIQHNPNIASGLDPVMKFFGNNPSRPATPIPDGKSWRTKIVSVTAEGDLVVVGIVRELPDPRSPGKTYTTTWFDMWRIQDGKADEHWDYGTIAPPAAGKGK
jgi:predicted SnoaL-like aldol condensation-catalyzing enzyme